MSTGEYELGAILDHCRRLIDAADEFVEADRTRSDKARLARTHWEGPYLREFDLSVEEESTDLRARARGFRAEADQWAQIWADAINQINQDRRQAAVDLISSNRGFGESFVDVFVGDDSGDQVRPYQPVTVPTEHTRYAATGGLETFD